MKAASLDTVRRCTGVEENGFFLRWTYVITTYGLQLAASAAAAAESDDTPGTRTAWPAGAPGSCATGRGAPLVVRHCSFL